MTRDWQTEWPPTRIPAVAVAETAAYLDPTEPVRLSLFPAGREAIVARTIFEVGGLYSVESIDDADNWYMGQRAPDGVIECWASYGDTETALRGL